MRAAVDEWRYVKSWLVYASGRVGAVATRPVALFMANNYLLPESAQALAIVFLANLMVTIWISTDPHRRFLTRHFGQPRSYNGVPFYLYAATLSLMIMAGAVIVLAGGLHFTKSIGVSLAAVAYFASERFADEIQRIRIFERDLDTWGRMSIRRSALQLVTFGILLALLGEAAPAWLVALVLAACNLVLFVPQLPRAFLRNLMRIRLPVLGWLGRRALNLLKESWPIWVTAQLTATFGYLDRGAALILDRSILPLFMLVVMCFSIVQLTLDFYYLSRYRRDFLERKVSLRSALTNRDFLLSFSAGIVLGVVACTLVLANSRSGAEFPWSYVAVIAFLQIAVGVSIIPREILYWSDRFRVIMAIEILFWVLFAIVATGGWWLRADLGEVFLLIVACASIRLAHYFVAASRILPATPGQSAGTPAPRHSSRDTKVRG